VISSKTVMKVLMVTTARRLRLNVAPAGSIARIASVRSARGRFGLVRQVESRARFRARHESIRRSKTRIHQSGAGAGLKVPDGFVHDIAQCAPSLQANVADLLRGQQVRHLKSFFDGSALSTKRIKRFAEETGVLAVREVAAGWSHRFGQNDMSGQFIASPFEILERAACVRLLTPPVNSRPVCII